ncbi:hypothetical protein K431DRAFT_280070 [Polychaeton citri CBS 116435]|uniref:Secreted protein n=1 Tax=Polychaeton citri CBS 116435 TaxID=1314669 RepID=A0A9P4QJF7_9PEZI|nr:hypothetical protein K431DRAFT_280070 [Polychaeton citri CBS 116435]
MLPLPLLLLLLLLLLKYEPLLSVASCFRPWFHQGRAAWANDLMPPGNSPIQHMHRIVDLSTTHSGNSSNTPQCHRRFILSTVETGHHRIHTLRWRHSPLPSTASRRLAVRIIVEAIKDKFLAPKSKRTGGM